MSIAFISEPIPLTEDEHGDIRVGDCRVLLDLVIQAFDDGATPETIVQMYSTLKLADVYAAIAYYLRHGQEVRDYMSAREERANIIRRTIQSQQTDMPEIRRRLVARKEANENSNASGSIHRQQSRGGRPCHRGHSTVCTVQQ